jgi:DNA polymerase-3 subunit alpha
MFERELLGFFLSDHPLNQKLNTLFTFATHKISDLPEVKNGTKVKIGGLVSTVKKIFTKRSNEEMAFVTIEDNLGISIECVVFPKTFERAKQYLTKDSIVIIEGKLDFKEELPVIIVEGVRILN